MINKIMEGVLKAVLGLFLILGGFFLGWMFRAMKARKITKEALSKEKG